MRGVVGTSIAGVCARGATSPFDRVMVGLSGAQTGCAGVLGLAGGRGARLGLEHAGLGLTEGSGGARGPVVRSVAGTVVGAVGVPVVGVGA